MEKRELGRSGISVSRVILGCGNFGGVGSSPAFFGQGIPKDEAFRIMDAGWELGLTTFDTADAPPKNPRRTFSSVGSTSHSVFQSIRQPGGIRSGW